MPVVSIYFREKGRDARVLRALKREARSLDKSVSALVRNKISATTFAPPKRSPR